MRLAIISVTSKGRELSENLKKLLNEDPSFIKIDLFHKDVKETLNRIFSDYDAIIGIMATGIMVRNICGLLNSKASDPAILVIDESSKHIISLVSGHLGGANQLTIKISQIMGSDPVITTATDVNNIISIDALARRYFWEIKNPQEILYFNRAILKGEKIGLLTDLNIDYIFKDPLISQNYYKIENKQLNKINNHEKANLNLKLDNNQISAILNEKILILKPKKIVAGIGSRKDVSQKQVIAALDKALSFVDLPFDRIDKIATAEIKSEEKGILAAAEYLGVKLDIISLIDIKNYESSQCSFSEFVEENFGVGGICEPAALIAAGDGARLIIKKSPFNGVTIAIAVL